MNMQEVPPIDVQPNAISEPQQGYGDIKEFLKLYLIDGKLELQNDNFNTSDLSFLETVNVQKLAIKYSDQQYPQFTNKYVTELQVENSQIENFKYLQLKNLESLQINNCNQIQECQYFASIKKLELDDVNNIECLFQKQACTTIQELSITNCELTSLDRIQLENIQVLHLIHSYCGNLRKLNIQNIKMYQLLRELNIKCYDSFDTTPLEQLNNLRIVRFEECNKIIINFNSQSINELSIKECNISKIKQFQLQNLQTLGANNFNTKQTNIVLHHIQCQNLKQLDLSDNEEINETLLETLLLQNTQIQTLNLNFCLFRVITNQNQKEVKQQAKFTMVPRGQQKYYQISSLKLLTQLERLLLNNCHVNTIDVLSNHINLIELDLSSNDCTDLTPLKNLVNLIKLNLEQCGIDTDITPIQYLTKLMILNLSGLDIIQLGPLSTLINLKELNLSCNNFEDITALQYLTELTILDMSGCELSNVDVFKFLVNLKELFLNGNENIDITPLQYLTHLIKLQLESCGLKSVEALIPLQNLKELDLSSNQIVYLQPLELLKQLKALTIQGNQVIQLSSYFAKLYKSYEIQHLLADQNQPTAQEIQIANILRDVNSPVTQLNSINRRFHAFKKSILGRKSFINERMKEQETSMVQFTGKVVKLFFHLNNRENYQ
ncbi:leucine_Rich Repeat (LRR)-containing protein [Hexamita inflata]|uniref:Leucine Rich Repeat (LRR)-containing protein n=1 Tax=Hexamita inflata TaxID=28002 RepID=A0AA86NK34_9EUKA|nr:leucine Rich Repeat (LRR)-containing protein [Hexamita inflata]